MARKLNQPKDFWHELKRRKVFNVVTVYAGTAFVIIQLVAAVKDPLHLPGWFPTMVIVLLCIGFLLAVFFSWVYEITPTGIKVTKQPVRTEKQAAQSIPKTSPGWKIATYASLVVIAALAGWHFFLEKSPQESLKRLRSASGKLTVAVMPFQNMTGDTALKYYRLAIQSNLSGNLSNYPEDLTVRQDEIINSMLETDGKANFASLTPSVAAGFSQKIEASIFIYGNFQKSGNKLRVDAQLIDAGTREILKSIPVENDENNIIPVCDSLSKAINNFLILNKLLKERPWVKVFNNTNSPEALKNCLLGMEFRRVGEWRGENYNTAMKLQKKALEIDPNFIQAKNEIATLYTSMELPEKAKEWFLSYYKDKDKFSISSQINLEFKHSELFGTPYDVINALMDREKLDDQDPATLWNIGAQYNRMYLYDKAIPYFKRALELCRKLEIKPLSGAYYIYLGIAYHKTGQFRKEKELYKIAEKDFPENRFLIVRQIILAMKLGNTEEANQYLEKYKLIYRGLQTSEGDLANSLAIRVYSEANVLENAEKLFRQAVKLEPEKKSIKYYFSYFLIDKERNVEEGLKVVDELLKTDPGNYSYLHSKGWGLHKQARYKEALDILQKSWDLRREKSIYWHDAWLHLEAARKAVAEMK